MVSLMISLFGVICQKGKKCGNLRVCNRFFEFSMVSLWFYGGGCGEFEVSKIHICDLECKVRWYL